MSPTLVLRHLAQVLTLDGTGPDGLGAIQDGAVAFEGGLIAWVGPDHEAPKGAAEVDCTGLIGLPGLIDCHTHLVWAGSRAGDFEARQKGKSYAEILEAGGGILSTVAATRRASEDELVAVASERLRAHLRRGVTTVEIKSGYGLNPEVERRMLVAARRAAATAGISVTTTFLGGHTIPAEWRHDRDAYVRQIIEEQLPAVRDVADSVDVYVDRGAFSVGEGRRILEAGIRAGLRPRIHAEQVEHTGAAAMAAALGATSADHLERIDAEGIAAMARAGTVGVLLPGAMLYLKDPAPPVQAMVEAGIPLAVATDLNPGSSPVRDLLGALTLAVLAQRLPLALAWPAVTTHAARALGLSDRGRIVAGLRADLALFRPPPGEPAEARVLVQYLGGHEAERVWVGGRPVVGG